ncbi:hypothetical protein JOF35_004989 [Streptomyces demainii]|uniref:Uncharacterized protein n=1 Tax=Streptomyces demainii TaxID=588122 RepID=A0ABT9KZ08_9ACTN|nr:hypothetical protein [Streptomyces demainii]
MRFSPRGRKRAGRARRGRRPHHPRQAPPPGPQSRSRSPRPRRPTSTARPVTPEGGGSWSCDTPRRLLTPAAAGVRRPVPGRGGSGDGCRPGPIHN